MNPFKLFIVLVGLFNYCNGLTCYKCEAPCDNPSKQQYCYVNENTGGCVKELQLNGIARGCISDGAEKEVDCENTFKDSLSNYRCTVCNQEDYCNGGKGVLPGDNRCFWPFNSLFGSKAPAPANGNGANGADAPAGDNGAGTAAPGPAGEDGASKWGYAQPPQPGVNLGRSQQGVSAVADAENSVSQLKFYIATFMLLLILNCF